MFPDITELFFFLLMTAILFLYNRVELLIEILLVLLNERALIWDRLDNLVDLPLLHFKSKLAKLVKLLGDNLLNLRFRILYNLLATTWILTPREIFGRSALWLREERGIFFLAGLPGNHYRI